MTRTTPALTLLLVAGAMLVVCADMDMGHGGNDEEPDEDFKLVFQSAKFGAYYGKAQSAKNENVSFLFIGTTLGPKDSLQNLTGSGLWKLSLYASETNDTLFGIPDYEQVLSAEESGASLSGGTVYVKGDPVVLSGMGGCPGDKSYVCYVFDQGDNPDPDFELELPSSGCLKLPLKCQQG